MRLFKAAPVTLVPLPSFRNGTLSNQLQETCSSAAMSCPKPGCITEGRSLFSAVFKGEYKEATFIDLTEAFDAINGNSARIKLHAIDLTSLVGRLFHQWGAKGCNLTDELR